MRSIGWFLPVVMCVTGGAQNADPDRAPDTTTYITHVTVIDTETGKEASDRTVVVASGKISDVRDSGQITAPVSAKVVDGRGKFVIPGLWDMHVHTWDYESTYALYIANGVTGVRDMFGPPNANKFRTELANKAVIAPHFYLASPIVDGHPPVWPDSIEVTTPKQARKVVDDQKEKGADFIKVYSRLTPDAYFAVAKESARIGIPFEGHVPVHVSASQASEAKQKSFEHLYGIAIACSTRERELQAKIVPAAPMKDKAAIMAEAARSYSESKCNRLFAQIKKNGNWQVPTLTVLRSFGLLNDPQFVQVTRLRYFTKEYRAWLEPKDDFRLRGWTASDFQVEREQFQFSKNLVGAMFRAGVPLLAGTDTGNPYCFPGFSLHDELALLVESGLTPLAALQAATSNAAVFMNASDHYGSVSRGKSADLVLLDADPLEDIHNTRKISEVFLQGREFDRNALDGLLASAERAADEELKRRAVQESKLTMPGRELQNLMLGAWTINVKYPPSSRNPIGQNAMGTEIWRPGPGGRSVIEEYLEKNSNGEIEGLAVAWWDKQAQGQRFVWCENSNPDGCYVSREVAKWNGERLEWKEEQDKRVYSEIFKDITADSFTQVLQEGEPGQPLQNTATISALRKSGPGMITERSMDDSGSNAESELRTFMTELRRANIQGDVDTVANSITDDYIQTDINGYRQSKTTWLNEYFKPLADLIKAGKFHWDENGRTNLQFRFYGDCAIVTGELHAKGTGAKPGAQHTWVPDPNASFSGTLHFTHVYIKQNGKWMLAALHNQIPPPPADAAK